MELKLQKRLLKPTLLTQSSIHSELEICKLIISTQLIPSAILAKNQYQQLINNAVQLEWNYIREHKKHQKLLQLSKQGKINSKRRQQHENQVKLILKEKQYYLKNKQMLSKDIQSKELAIKQIQLINKSLKEKNFLIQKAISQQQAQNQRISKKIAKLAFVINETLYRESKEGDTIQKIMKKKKQMKDRMSQKMKQLSRKKKQYEQKILDMQINQKQKQHENNKVLNQIEQLQGKISKKGKKLHQQQSQIEQINNLIAKQKAKKLVSEQKLEKTKQSLDKVKKINQYLIKQNKNLYHQFIQFQFQQMKILEQTLEIEQILEIQTEHAQRILQTI